ncbi:MAG: glycoside hydrolase [Mangrovibacterium sp.]
MKRMNIYCTRTARWGLLIVLLTSLMMSAMPAHAFIPAEINLKGYWKFRIGDRSEWSSPTYNDSDWDDIRVPARWEDEGFQGYDGFAWYRNPVVIPESMKGQALILQLGYIDDVDEVYLNGKKIGQSGSFPPHSVTAYNALRKYQIPGDLINFGKENLIAVRVYDSQLSGGIVSGEIKMFSTGEIPPFDIDLNGEWLFNKGRQYDESEAVTIQVPGQWENQGFYNYDGYAVYTRKIRVTKAMAEQRTVLVAGRIDDVDQLVINGQVIGQTGDYNKRNPETRYREFRNYFIPPGVFKADQENLVEIRVLDTGVEGGIIEGSVGLVTQDKFRAYWKSKRVDAR